MIDLVNIKPFAQGGNRLCFAHPADKRVCIKVRRTDFTLKDLRRTKPFPKNLRPLTSFDDNLEEYQVLNRLQRKHGDQAFDHISRCYGFADTNLGKGLLSELLRDYDDKISLTIKQHIMEYGISDAFNEALGSFCSFWDSMAIPSRDLLIHNIVVHQFDPEQAPRLVVIDGLGYSGIIPERVLPQSFFNKKAQRKTLGLQTRIQDFYDKLRSGYKPRQIGLVLHRDDQ